MPHYPEGTEKERLQGAYGKESVLHHLPDNDDLAQRTEGRGEGKGRKEIGRGQYALLHAVPEGFLRLHHH